MTSINSMFATFIYRAWRKPKSMLTAGIRKTCDELPPKQRLLVVTVLLSAFVLTAFFVFGHACYKIGARQAYYSIEVEHLRTIDLPTSSQDANVLPADNHQMDSAYDSAGMENQD